MLTVLRRLRQRFHTRQRRGAVVLAYHSVAEVAVDPWRLHVTPRFFEEHLEVIRSMGTPIPLSDLLDAAHSRQLPRGAIALTFDDGYANNLEHGVPALAVHDVPATFFVTSGFVGMQREAWWDELEQLLLLPGSLPQHLTAGLPGADQTIDLGDAANYSMASHRQHAAWAAWEPAPTSRHDAYARLWSQVHQLAVDQRTSVTAGILRQAGRPVVARPTHRFLSADELIELAGSHGVTIGAHSVTHPVLARLPVAEQRAEIAGSRNALRKWLGVQVHGFSYPFGKPEHASRETVRLVREAGFTHACLSVPSAVRHRTSDFHVPRLHIPNCDGEQFGRRLHKWLSA